MGNKKSKAADRSDDTARAEQTSTRSIDAVLQGKLISAQMVQNVHLIWLDSSIDEKSRDYDNTISQLRSVVNTIHTFTDGDQCTRFLETIDNEKACVIVSGSFGQQIVPRIHNMSQVDSIFIFCDHKRRHEKWVKRWSKIRGVFTEISPICEALREVARQCEQNAIPISLMAVNGDISKKSLDQLHSSFMYTQILKEILLEIDFESKHFEEYIDHCRRTFTCNISESENVKKLATTYRNETPIWWYTYQCFLYPMLNRGLRLMDVGLIIQMGFFIGDLHRQIEQLHKEQFGGQQTGKIFTVYRGQGMSKTDFEQMSKTKGGLISFDNFLSTSKDRKVAFGFARRPAVNPDSVGILFVMTIDPSQSTTPFASIADVSYYKDREDEVLFAMHTIFRIYDIKGMSETPRLFQVDLTLTRDNDKDLRILTDRIRQETFLHDERWYRLGSILLRMGLSSKAEEVYENLLAKTSDESTKASIYHQIGCVKDNQGEYNEAIKSYEKSLEISKNLLPWNHPTLAICYNNIGNVYSKMDQYSRALSSYEQALTIQQQSFPPNYPSLAMCFNNIGNVYSKIDQYSKALSYYEKALEIRQQSLPPNHPDLACSYGNIGNMYHNTGKYSIALSYYEKTHEILEKTLPVNHPDLSKSYNNIGLVYENMGNYSKAHSFCERAVNTAQELIPSYHPDMLESRRNLDRIKKKL